MKKIAMFLMSIFLIFTSTALVSAEEGEKEFTLGEERINFDISEENVYIEYRFYPNHFEELEGSHDFEIEIEGYYNDSCEGTTILKKTPEGLVPSLIAGCYLEILDFEEGDYEIIFQISNQNQMFLDPIKTNEVFVTDTYSSEELTLGNGIIMFETVDEGLHISFTFDRIEGMDIFRDHYFDIDYDGVFESSCEGTIQYYPQGDIYAGCTIDLEGYQEGPYIITLTMKENLQNFSDHVKSYDGSIDNGTSEITLGNSVVSPTESGKKNASEILEELLQKPQKSGNSNYSSTCEGEVEKNRNSLTISHSGISTTALQTRIKNALDKLYSKVETKFDTYEKQSSIYSEIISRITFIEQTRENSQNAKNVLLVLKTNIGYRIDEQKQLFHCREDGIDLDSVLNID